MDTPQDQSQSTPKQQVVERLKQANNVLVTVKTNPSVDELAATIGLTLMLNKLDKHATAVFSGEVPSTLEFLKPEETIEANTDSLRDFIVSLDKSKADKLRYKVEENVVKIFITPYRTSITEEDLEFTQGDFNVDVVVALGITQREEIDQAIMTHGRILHDATVIAVTAGQDISELGQINWQEPAASSLSEMLVSISEAFQGGLIDEQIATAYLTGIVSETERFSNPKTTPKVMTMSAQLMAAGANQQLIANELEKAVEVDVQAPEAAEENEQLSEAPETTTSSSDGTLKIQHSGSPDSDSPAESSESADNTSAELPEISTETPSEDNEAAPVQDEPVSPPSQNRRNSLLVAPPERQDAEPMDSYNPLMDSSDSSAEASSSPEPQLGSNPDSPAPAPEAEKPEPIIEQVVPETTEDDGQIDIDHEGNLIRKNAVNPKHKIIQPLSNQEPVSESPEQPPVAPAAEQKSETAEPTNTQQSDSVLPPPPELDLTPAPPIPDTTTLEQLERVVDSPHLDEVEQAKPAEGLDNARNAVDNAVGLGSFGSAPTPRADLNANPVNLPTPAPFDSYRLPSSPDINDKPTPPDAPAEPDFSLGEIIPEDNHNNPMSPPPVPPPMFPRS